MRLILIILTLLSFNTLSQSIKSTYLINHKSKTSTYVLHLRDNNKYEVLEFLKSKDIYLIISMSDTGNYVTKKKLGIQTISFTSEKKKKLIVKGTYFIYKDKLYEKLLDPFKKIYKAVITLDTGYQKTIPYEKNKKNKEIKKEYTKSFFLTNIKKYSTSYLDVIAKSYVVLVVIRE